MSQQELQKVESPQEVTQPEQSRTTRSPFDYHEAWKWLEQKGRQLMGPKFKLHEEDSAIINTLFSYFLKDQFTAAMLNINLNKGILLLGPVGCGKTSLMRLMAYVCRPKERHIMKPCREVSYEFINEGYEVIHRYSRGLASRYDTRVFCFDDLGTEKSLKYYGNECNVMAEILLSRYDQFVMRGLVTHLTTNLNASEIEAAYGVRVRSRLREMFNLVGFEKGSVDKRK